MPADGLPRRRFLVRVVEAAISVALLLALVAFVVFVLAPGAIDPRFAARTLECRNNLKQVELALHNYHDVWGRFPPAVTRGPDGEPWHSWRTLILPFFDESERAIYDRYRLDQPWDGPENRKLVAEFPTLRHYCCPEERARGSPPAVTSPWWGSGRCGRLTGRPRSAT